MRHARLDGWGLHKHKRRWPSGMFVLRVGSPAPSTDPELSPNRTSAAAPAGLIINWPSTSFLPISPSLIAARCVPSDASSFLSFEPVFERRNPVLNSYAVLICWEVGFVSQKLLTIMLDLLHTRKRCAARRQY